MTQPAIDAGFTLDEVVSPRGLRDSGVTVGALVARINAGIEPGFAGVCAEVVDHATIRLQRLDRGSGVVRWGR